MRREPALEVTDRQLAEAVLADGDEGAFRQLYQRHTPRLFQFVMRLLGGVELDAEDVVQETWIRAVKHLDGFRWGSRFSTWLTAIGLNVCRELWRKRNGRDLDWNVDTVEAPRVASDERIDLERAISALPAGRRTVLVLHDLEGLTHEEIGERLGISAGTSKSQLFCARRSMRELLQTSG
jgi:RNA polymerase sigma-70 factor (ECF subfamily)